VGDSITDDLQSWAEILRHVLELRRPRDGLRVINTAISGDTSTHLITRFSGVVQEQPAWILCMIGTNDARQHGLQPLRPLVCPEETARNLESLRHFAATQCGARWVWLTPPFVIEEKIPAHWYLGPMQIAWSNRDLASAAEIVRRQPGRIVDLQNVFGDPPDPALLLEDGLHPSLEGQKAILRALVDSLADYRASLI
jgi:lysophospholipase L1-like esterase